NESVLRALLRLFALVTEVSDEHTIELVKNKVRAYLQHKITARYLDTYLSEFEEYLFLFSKPSGSGNEKKARKASTLGSVKVIMVCERINENLSRNEKITVLIRLTEFVHKGGQISFREINFLETLAKIFNVDDDIYALIQHFVIQDEQENESLLYVGNGQGTGNWLQREHLSGRLVV